MKPSTSDWIDKAEDNWDLALRASRFRKRAHHDAVCYNAQQCAEKYFKARLNEAALKFAKTHDLLDLLNEIITLEPTLTTLRLQADALNEFAVLYCYPGHDATKAQAKQAIKDCRVIRNILRTIFGLPI